MRKRWITCAATSSTNPPWHAGHSVALEPGTVKWRWQLWQKMTGMARGRNGPRRAAGEARALRGGLAAAGS
jgi:hypothetical protein